MIVAYVTTDEVNQAFAMQLAAECRVTLCPLAPQEAAQTAAFDAVVYDWDYLPLQRQQEILAELLSGPALYPVAVHSYNLDEDQAAALRKHEVAVYRCLQPEVFRLLRLSGFQTGQSCLLCSGPDDDPDLKDRLLRRLAELSQGREGQGIIPLQG
jgi:hypothetical protein